jgi:hypothetical protein
MEWLREFEEGIARSTDFRDRDPRAAADDNYPSAAAAKDRYPAGTTEDKQSRATDGDVGIQEKGMEGNTMEEGNAESEGELQEAFGNTLGFPTQRRPAESKRSIDIISSDEEILKWFNQNEEKKIQVGEQLMEAEKSQALQLLYTWKDQFCSDVRKLPATDMIEHRIPTIKCHPVRMKPKLYTSGKYSFLSKLTEAWESYRRFGGTIESCSSLRLPKLTNTYRGDDNPISYGSLPDNDRATCYGSVEKLTGATTVVPEEFDTPNYCSHSGWCTSCSCLQHNDKGTNVTYIEWNYVHWQYPSQQQTMAMVTQLSTGDNHAVLDLRRRGTSDDVRREPMLGVSRCGTREDIRGEPMLGTRRRET